MTKTTTEHTSPFHFLNQLHQHIPVTGLRFTPAAKHLAPQFGQAAYKRGMCTNVFLILGYHFLSRPLPTDLERVGPLAPREASASAADVHIALSLFDADDGGHSAAPFLRARLRLLRFLLPRCLYNLNILVPYGLFGICNLK